VAVFTDVTIRKRIKSRDLKISPLTEANITGVGYDVTCSDIILLREHGETRRAFPKNDHIHVPAGALLLVMTKEFVALSSRVVGTIHSSVPVVSAGMSHISTTIDPNWYGRLLLAFTNTSSSEVALPLSAPIATIVFHTAADATKRKTDRPKGRSDIISYILKREEIKLSVDDPVLQAAIHRDLTDEEDSKDRAAIGDFAANLPRIEFWRKTVQLGIGAILLIAGIGVLWKGAQLLPLIWPDANQLTAEAAITTRVTLGLAFIAGGWRLLGRR
jgi:deoxycytidine triphosphate deaminase